MTRSETAGQVPAPTVADPYLTEVLAYRERGRQVLATLANRKSLSVTTILNTVGSCARGAEAGNAVGTARWLDEVMSCSIEVKFGQVTQTHRFGLGQCLPAAATPVADRSTYGGHGDCRVGG